MQAGELSYPFLKEPIAMIAKHLQSARLLTTLLLGLAIPHQLTAAGPAVLNLRSTANFSILAGAGITTTGGGTINGDVGASPIAGSAIGVTDAQVNGIIYAVDASGPAGSVIDPARLTTAKGDLTTAFNDARDRVPVPTGPFLNPGAGNIGGLVLVPGLYKFTSTTLITGADVTLVGGADDVWIFQCATDLQLGSGIRVILVGGAQAKNIFWQVGTSAVLGTSSVFKGTILADQSITMNTSSTMDGRALAFSAGVVYNGAASALPTSPEIAVEQPVGFNVADGGSRNFGPVLVGGSSSLIFSITNSGDANLTLTLPITVTGLDAAQFTVTVPPTTPVLPGDVTTFTVRFVPTTAGVKAAALQFGNNDSDENPFDIVLAGSGSVLTAPEIAVEQPVGVNLADGGTKDFGPVLVGGSSSVIFTITNSGTANLTLTLPITITGLDAAQFTVTVPPTTPVLPGDVTAFTVRFAPTSAGVKAAALQFGNNDADENPFDIILAGSGSLVPLPEIAVEQPVGVNLPDGGSKNFGAVLVGSSSSLIFTITNSGDANLTLTLPITITGVDAAEFTVTVPPTTPVLPGDVTTFTVRFAPLTPGVKAAALQFGNNDADENPFDIVLAGSGSAVPIPEIAVEQPVGVNLPDGGSKDFGAVLVGSSTSLIFTITNSGTANLVLTLPITFTGVDAAQFTVTAPPTSPVPPGGSTAFSVRFAPLSAGAKTAALQLVNNDSNEGIFDIILLGTGTAVPIPEIAVEQPVGVNIPDGGSRNFGAVLVGSSTSFIFTITNSGDANLTLALPITFTGVDAAEFTVTAPPTSPVLPAGSTTFTVRFAPLTPGVKAAALQLVNNDGNEGIFDIVLSGTGTALPIPEIAVEQPVGVNIADGGSKNFGSVLVGSSTSLIFTITNSGDANLILTLPITFTGVDAAQFTVTAPPTSPVLPAGSTTFTVRFAPVAGGAKAAALQIVNNDSNEGIFDINLLGTGLAPEIAISQPPGTDLPDGGAKNFGVVLVGASTNLTFTITNSGDANLILTLPITFDGVDASLFTVTTPPTTPVIPGGSTTFIVRFAPLSPGVKTAGLHLVNNDGNESPFDLTLTGTAVAPEIAVEQPVGTNLADGGGKDFGTVLVGTSTSLTFTIRNTGSANLTLTLPITFDGANASLFTVTTPPTSPVIPGGSTTFTVRFAPLSPGVKTAGLHFANNDGDENPFDLALTGTGIAPEIVVEQPVGTNLADGGGKDFGPVLVGTSTSLTFTLRNTGSANLNLTLPITIDGVDASLFTVTAPPTTPVIPGGSTTFTVRFTPVSPGVGVKIAALHLANDDSDENPFDLTLTGIGTGAFVVTTSLVTQNPQTSLFEQTVRVTNSSSSTLAAIRMLIQGLPGDVQILNASGTNGSAIPYVQHDFPLVALGTVDFLIEYYRVSRVPFASPVFTVEVTTAAPATAIGPILTIGRDVQLASGRFLIDFFSVPGGRYAVQYSSDLTIWKTANPIITSPANRVQWYDDGPPKTEGIPGSIGTRFYRVIQLP